MRDCPPRSNSINFRMGLAPLRGRNSCIFPLKENFFFRVTMNVSFVSRKKCQKSVMKDRSKRIFNGIY